MYYTEEGWVLSGFIRMEYRGWKLVSVKCLLFKAVTGNWLEFSVTAIM